MVGPYRLLFRLGKGGMGEVWAAQRGGQFGFERLVALKLLRGAAKDSNAAVMFFDEARAASALQHAAIVPTFDLGQYGTTFYIAMGMVRGPSLTALLQRLAVKKVPISPAIVAYIGERLASALDYAYGRAEIDGKKLRLIHRDISPHNVLIDETGNVVLTDFGVARTAVQDHESRVGTVRGKPSYMAPEQVQGSAMDARTDLFALGIVLYESACVKRLFGRSNPVKSMEAVVHYTPKPLPTIVEGFPEALWNVISKSLEKDPAQRYQSASDMARALAEVQKSLPGAATAARDLATLINEVFPTGSFDVDARVKEALEQQAAEAPAPEVMEATKYEPRRASQPGVMAMPDMQPQAFAEAVGTQAAWPTAMPSPDPLDPDALADLQAQLAAGGTFAPTSSGSMPNFSSYPNLTGTQLPPVRKNSNALVWLAGTAAVLCVSAAAMIMLRPTNVPHSDAQQLATDEPTPEPQVSVAPQATPRATMTAVPASALPTPAPTSAAPTPSPTSNPNVQRPRTPTPSPSTTVAATPERTPSPKPGAPVELTRESVLKEILKVRDSAKRSTLMANLSEAGQDSTALGILMKKVQVEQDSQQQ
ncbi:MAG: protein kinase [Myxococcota bacterium]